eukprot:CAMPEP_0179188698 /NCGR_PEP_ID=MMETSP0796-20121207/93661_1 /TAXON_ID=73915 /ORGANISM="Pyrodinium bahamense, Strain pbaha01" /LENGTH=121 /DNA_ID=CAMNT_0020892811 /DNA_START=512 /DNA_END=874 /DNA_ORIENTATION=-
MARKKIPGDDADIKIGTATDKAQRRLADPFRQPRQESAKNVCMARFVPTTVVTIAQPARTAMRAATDPPDSSRMSTGSAASCPPSAVARGTKPSPSADQPKSRSNTTNAPAKTALRTRCLS